MKSILKIVIFLLLLISTSVVSGQIAIKGYYIGKQHEGPKQVKTTILGKKRTLYINCDDNDKIRYIGIDICGSLEEMSEIFVAYLKKYKLELTVLEKDDDEYPSYISYIELESSMLTLEYSPLIEVASVSLSKFKIPEGYNKPKKPIDPINDL